MLYLKSIIHVNNSGAFNALFLRQIYQNMHANGHLQFLYNLMLTVQAKWQRDGAGAGLNRPTPTAFSYRFDNSRCTLWANGWDPSQPN